MTPPKPSPAALRAAESINQRFGIVFSTKSLEEIATLIDLALSETKERIRLAFEDAGLLSNDMEAHNDGCDVESRISRSFITDAEKIHDGCRRALANLQPEKE